jgi:hypothetical protein
MECFFIDEGRITNYEQVATAIAASTAAHSPSSLAPAFRSLKRYESPPPFFPLEFLPAINFGESFRFDGCFDFDDLGVDGSVSVNTLFDVNAVSKGDLK